MRINWKLLCCVLGVLGLIGPATMADTISPVVFHIEATNLSHGTASFDILSSQLTYNAGSGVYSWDRGKPADRRCLGPRGLARVCHAVAQLLGSTRASA